MMNRVDKIWWLNPVWIYFGWVMFAMYCSTIDSQAFNAMYEEPIYINMWDVMLYILFFLAFLLGYKSYKVNKNRLITIRDIPIVKLSHILKILYVGVIAAYIIWFFNLYLQYGGSLIIGVVFNLTGSYNLFQNEGGGNISGITTCTELGMIATPLCVYMYCLTRKKRYMRMFLTLLALATLRAAIFAERLAILELLIPSAVIYAYYGNFFRRSVCKFVPLFAILGLLFVFGFFEYYRSWDFYRESYDDNIVAFTVDRVFGYYSIAINTECIQINFLEPRYFPWNSINWLWKIPGFSLLPNYLMNWDNIDYLTKWGNPEFNNPGGLLFAYIDFGILGLVVQFIFGRFVSKVYKGYCRGAFIDSLWYAGTVLCLLELPRYFFWGSPRAFFAIVAIFIIKTCLGQGAFKNQKRKVQLNNLHY